MNEMMKQLHLEAGLIAGRERTCGLKQDHKTEENAAKAAASLNRSGKARHEVEPYPCAFCEGWHIGRVMPENVLRQIIEEG